MHLIKFLTDKYFAGTFFPEGFDSGTSLLLEGAHDMLDKSRACHDNVQEEVVKGGAHQVIVGHQHDQEA